MYQPLSPPGSAPPPPPPLPPYPHPRRQVPVLVPHLIWEAVLLLLVVVVVAVAAARTPLFDNDGIWWSLGIVGLLASGLALSLRTGTPNLAVASIAAMSGALYAVLVIEAEQPPVLAALTALVAVMVVGGVLGVVTGLTSAPAWAVSLAGLAFTQAVALAVADAGGLLVTEGVLLDEGAWWFAIFLLLSLGGAAICAIPPVRRLLGGRDGSARTAAVGRPGFERPALERSALERPALERPGATVRFSGAGLLVSLMGFVGSSALAGLAGIAMVSQLRSYNYASFNIFVLLVALAAVLVGGVSAFGGRGGIAGTALGVALVTITWRWVDIELALADADRWLHQSAPWMLIAVATLAGIGVSRALEAIAPAGPHAPQPVPAVPFGIPPHPMGPPPAGPPPAGPPPAGPPAAGPPAAGPPAAGPPPDVAVAPPAPAEPTDSEQERP